jgi:hypothetical protein
MVQILSPRPAESRSIVRETGRAAALVFPASVELIEHGGVRLADEDLAQLAANVGLASGLVARVIDRWMQDGNDGPAFLARVDGEADRFTLGAMPTPPLSSCSAKVGTARGRVPPVAAARPGEGRPVEVQRMEVAPPLLPE